MADNNLIEQDHRSIKLRLGPMLGVKRFRCASITIDGLEFTHRILGLTMAASYSVLMVRGKQKSVIRMARSAAMKQLGKPSTQYPK